MNLVVYLGFSGYVIIPKKGLGANQPWFDKFMDIFKAALFSYVDSSYYEAFVSQLVHRPNEVDIMMDSGAYSVWKSGAEVDIDEYIKFCLDVRESSLWQSLVFVALDKIPGTLKTPATQGEVDMAIEESYNNYIKMRDAGLSCLPVYHLGEPMDVFKRYIDVGADYVGLGGMARGVSDRNRRKWLDSVFNYLDQNNLNVATHGFGVTASSLVSAYNWKSVDSVSLLMSAGYGSIFIYDENRKKLRTMYVTGLTNKKIYELNKKYLEDLYGVPFEEMQLLWCRRYLSLLAWLKFQDYIDKIRSGKNDFTYQQTLF